jgi:hypothetical protein
MSKKLARMILDMDAAACEQALTLVCGAPDWVIQADGKVFVPWFKIKHEARKVLGEVE